MNEWVKILVSSSVIASIFGGVVSWFTASQKIDQERYSRQGEAGYEALIKANALYWQSKAMGEEAEKGKDLALATEAKRILRESDASYVMAQQRIAAFGSASVIKTMSEYYNQYTDAGKACENSSKFRADVRIYQAIRSTLGIGGSVSDEELATIVFRCKLQGG